MKKMIAALAAGVAVSVAVPATATAGGCPGPYCGSGPPPAGLFSYLFEKRPVPAFQAAPWYLYWPYHGHFMTPAPMGGAYYGPPAAGAMVNPYFPAAGGYPAAMPAGVPAAMPAQ